MALTSLSAISFTLVAGPTGTTEKAKPAVVADTTVPIGQPTEASKKLPKLSEQEIKDNVNIDIANSVLTKVPTKFLGITTGYTYKFNPEIYEEINGKKPNFAELKQRYNLPDRTFAESDLKGYCGNLDSLKVDYTVSIPTNMIDKYVDKN